MTITSTKRLARIRQRYAEKIRESRKHISKWTTELKNDPHEAFRWGQGALVAQANLRVAQQVVALIDAMPKVGQENGMTPSERIVKLFETIRREALNKANWVPASSSQISNLAEQYLTAAYADAVRDLEFSAAFVTVIEED